MGWHGTSSRLFSCETVTRVQMVNGQARHIVTVVFMCGSNIVVGGQSGSAAAALVTVATTL